MISQNLLIVLAAAPLVGALIAGLLRNRIGRVGAAGIAITQGSAATTIQGAPDTARPTRRPLACSMPPPMATAATKAMAAISSADAASIVAFDSGVLRNTQ